MTSAPPENITVTELDEIQRDLEKLRLLASFRASFRHHHTTRDDEWKKPHRKRQAAGPPITRLQRRRSCQLVPSLAGTHPGRRSGSWQASPNVPPRTRSARLGQAAHTPALRQFNPPHPF
ncbi:hypothetical protein GQ600_894 [Phytophthora cactorum]|nr:hypothetical protein GQ600_894 [Phytophthora cactorum]